MPFEYLFLLGVAAILAVGLLTLPTRKNYS